MSKKIRSLFIPSDALGHVKAAIGIAQELIECGHEVSFLIDVQWKGRLIPYGIKEFLLNLENRDEDADPEKEWADRFVGGGAIKATSALETTVNIYAEIVPKMIEELKKLDLILEDLLESIRPDIIIIDHSLCIPSVEVSGIPWVLTCSFNPLALISDERTPPYGSGLPTIGFEKECKEFRNSINNVFYDIWKNWNNYVISRGLEPLKELQSHRDSKYLNIYGFPQELDYSDLRPLPPKWYRFDNFMRTDQHLEFEIPEQLKGKPGKLIYFSMGSMGSADVEMMKRLVAILGKSKHRYIVSKGPLHSQYSLSDNMFGEKSLPQIQVLPIVDLVITHGGNNTITETFYFGKPMIVMPLFGDQNDNAQRVEEKGYGIRLNPYECTENELLNAIEKLLNDKELKEKLKKISQRIQTENSIAKLPKMIESLIKM